MPTKAQLMAALRRMRGSKKKGKKTTAGKKKKSTGGLAAYQRKIKNAPGVKTKTARVKKLETDLKRARAEKMRAVKAAQKKYKSKK